MKIAYGSDLHCEFDKLVPSLDSVSEADVLILAGDIDVGYDSNGHIPKALIIANQCAEELGVPVIIVAGNHEFYGCEYYSYLEACRCYASDNKNIHFLENEQVDIEGVSYSGCTLWTNFSAATHLDFAVAYAQMLISDYKRISFRASTVVEAKTLCPRDTIKLSQESLAFLEAAVCKPNIEKTVFITHSPSISMSDPKFDGDPLSCYFCNNLDYAIKTGTLSPDLWVCGHTHFSTDIYCGRTRIVSNQRGYLGESTGFDWRIVEI